MMTIKKAKNKWMWSVLMVALLATAPPVALGDGDCGTSWLEGGETVPAANLPGALDNLYLRDDLDDLDNAGLWDEGNKIAGLQVTDRNRVYENPECDPVLVYVADIKLV